MYEALIFNLPLKECAKNKCARNRAARKLNARKKDARKLSELRYIGYRFIIHYTEFLRYTERLNLSMKAASNKTTLRTGH